MLNSFFQGSSFKAAGSSTRWWQGQRKKPFLHQPGPPCSRQERPSPCTIALCWPQFALQLMDWACSPILLRSLPSDCILWGGQSSSLRVCSVLRMGGSSVAKVVCIEEGPLFAIPSLPTPTRAIYLPARAVQLWNCRSTDPLEPQN